MGSNTVKELVALIGTSLVHYGNAFLLIRSTKSGPEVECLAPSRVIIDGKRLEIWPVEAPEAYAKARIQMIRQMVIELYGQIEENWRGKYKTQYGELLEFLSAMEDRAPE